MVRKEISALATTQSPYCHFCFKHRDGHKEDTGKCVCVCVCVCLEKHAVFSWASESIQLRKT